MRSDVVFTVTYEAGFGTSSAAGKTLLELLTFHRSECEYYGVKKTWHEGRYEISKYHSGEAVKRYAKKYIIEIDPPKEKISSKNLISEIIKGIEFLVGGSMMSLINDLNNSGYGGIYDLFSVGSYSRENPMAKRGKLINDNKNTAIKMLPKHDPFKQTILKIPR